MLNTGAAKFFVKELICKVVASTVVIITHISKISTIVIVIRSGKIIWKHKPYC